MLLSSFVNRIRTWLSRLRSSKSKAASTLPRPVSGPRSLSPEDREQRAKTAQELLSNPLLLEAVGALEADIVNQIKSVSLADKEGHTRLVMAMQISSAVTRHLWNAVQDGVQAKEHIQLRGSRID